MSRLGVSAAFTFQNAAVANGNGNTMSVDGYTSILISVVSSVAMSGGTTVNFEASTDGTNWTALAGEKIGAAPTAAATTTADGDFRFNVAGYRKVRCRISAYSAGTTTITGNATMATANAAQAVQVAGGVSGNVGSGSTDSGNPVKVAGVFNTTLPTFTNGQRGDMQVGSRGALNVAIFGSASTSTVNIAALADGAGAAPTGMSVASYPMLHNGTTVDRQRGNVDTAALISAAGATTSQNSADQTNYNARGLKVVLDMTVVGTGSVTVTIQGKDPVSGKYYTLLAGAAVVTNVTNIYTVYPGVTAAANVAASDVLPRTWRVITTANNANATTYSVAASVIV